MRKWGGILERVSRRQFLKGLIGGLVAGGIIGAGITYVAAPEALRREITGQPSPQPGPFTPVPSRPLKMGIQTFFRGGGAVLGEPIYSGAVLAAEEINEAGGILGRKIEWVARDEGTAEESVREYRKLVEEDKIDFFVGITSSGNTTAIGPVAEELGMITLFADGCTDFLFEQGIKDPKFVFRITNIQSADGIAAAIGAIKYLDLMKKDKIRFAHIHPDYAYGRNAHAHISIVLEKVLGKDRVEFVYEGWPGLFRVTDFSPYITEIMANKPDLVATSLWGGDFVNFYKQALGYGLFARAKLVTTLSHGAKPQATGSDYPDGQVAGVHANYYFLYPHHETYPINKSFVERYYKRWNEYPNFEAEGGYVAVYLYKNAVELASKLRGGGWPGVDEIIAALEGMTIYGPAGPLHIRARQPNKHQGYKDGIIGISKFDPKYGFSILVDPLVIPISRITVPEGWDGTPDPKAGTLAYSWIRATWKEGVLPI
jgi:branched-chain amino acid transport system substrate-binding protein